LTARAPNAGRRRRADHVKAKRRLALSYLAHDLGGPIATAVEDHDHLIALGLNPALTGERQQARLDSQLLITRGDDYRREQARIGIAEHHDPFS
jgi:hypothetical protein